MSTRRADHSLVERVVKMHRALDALSKDLYAHGDREVGDAVKRARRELEHPAVTGPINEVGTEETTRP